MRIVVTGGAGFVGSFLALAFTRASSTTRVVAFDSLRRRGSERNIERLVRHGVEFVHGDVRIAGDLESVGRSCDWLIDAAAEPSVLAGMSESPAHVMRINLLGTLNCLEFCRRRGSGLLFLSTSRVYSIAPLRELALREADTRFELAPEQTYDGVSSVGIQESFPTHLPRSYYGTSKLASELLVQEYAEREGLPAIIDRCGTLAGPRQFGHSEQGVFTYWLASHHFGWPLVYTGFGGTGKQVRDLLHPADLFDLVETQMKAAELHSGRVFNVGGGLEGSVSLQEYTEVCRDLTGASVEVTGRPDTNTVDVPYYVSDHRLAREAFGWSPRRDVRTIAAETLDWIRDNEAELGSILSRKARQVRSQEEEA